MAVRWPESRWIAGDDGSASRSGLRRRRELPSRPRVLPLAAGLGIVAYAAFGLDFPRSRRRFSRLV
jgi:hypothetical protein